MKETNSAPMNVRAPQKLRRRWRIYDLPKLKAKVEQWRQGKKTVVLANGCFDVLHIGHIMLLREAKLEGDRLVVAINSDESVKHIKGEQRPLLNERERARMVAALDPVDAVVIFDDHSPLSLITLLKPDVIVKGEDYAEKDIVGLREIQEWKGRVKRIPLVEGVSTTSMIERLRGRHP
jgi:D-beta-D-heptose 7-phosphate kinase/D-beta-D-heptose 1-phosphate adenosyltransferase